MAKKREIPSELIPLDKSWVIRHGVMDIIRNEDYTSKILSEPGLGDDIVALRRAKLEWATSTKIDIGESGTLYRYLSFTAAKQGLNKEFIKHGTLRNRPLSNAIDIIGLSQVELLALDHGSTQWASAAVLNGDDVRLPNPKPKLALTYEAVTLRNSDKMTTEKVRRLDPTILEQAEVFLALVAGDKKQLEPTQAEDYCFARTFGYMAREEGEKLWPNIKGHESNRFVEMDKALESIKKGKEVETLDHRVAQAAAMYGVVKGVDVRIKHPMAVNKTWPQFWNFLKWAEA